MDEVCQYRVRISRDGGEGQAGEQRLCVYGGEMAGCRGAEGVGSSCGYGSDSRDELQPEPQQLPVPSTVLICDSKMRGFHI